MLRIIPTTYKDGRSLSSHKIYLITGKDWDSVKFYEAFGYQKTGELPKHYTKKNFIKFSKLI